MTTTRKIATGIAAAALLLGIGTATATAASASTPAATTGVTAHTTSAHTVTPFNWCAPECF